MGVIPIIVESRRHQQFRNGRAIPAGDKGRRGSNGRISANSVRRGSNGRIGPGIEFVRRGSNSRISFENTRRGSCGRSADMNRRGSAGGVKLDIRRGSVGRTETDSSSFQDNLQIRRGSGAGILKQLPRRGSRQNLKSLTINIFVEGGEEKKDREKKRLEDKDEDKKENKEDKEKIEKDGEERKERKYIKGRSDEDKENKSQDGLWKVLDRELVKVRGGGEVQVNPVSGGILQQRRGDLNPTPGSAGTRRTQTLSVLPREKVLKKDLSNCSQELKNKSQEKNIKCENTFSKFAKDAVNSHNKYRTKHGVKPLELDLDL
ncbi:nucleolar protein 58 [Eurytemora carolleeae]|uniref:nucleolar protein 58 n=1 Tax=Eurytemora carolleeae TaxID=1294199 RepID=UPI000C7594C8|nr:nucleolar protein 58 [Eurytemora carolleeae]|eukprot:XP_023341365.1 nucleolar protein 58-like [Eurytemora affinis]